MASVLATISEILSISDFSLNVMLDCVCECTDFKHNFKSERETKIAFVSYGTYSISFSPTNRAIVLTRLYTYSLSRVEIADMPSFSTLSAMSSLI